MERVRRRRGATVVGARPWLSCRAVAELPDRAAWLTAVALGMDAMPGAEAEVLEELAAHLDDRVADALARGVDPAEAERRARNRLGDPATLGRAIRKARRAKRSALALVGGGAFSFAYFSVTGIVLAVAFLGVISGLTVTIGSWALSTEWWRVPGSWVGLGASLIGLPWAARVASASVASWLPWPFGTVRVAMAVLVLLMSMAVVALLPGQELDPVLALLFPVVPLVAAVSALLAPRSTSLRPGWPMVIVAVMVDEPRNGMVYGGEVAAPVFSQVVQQTLRIMGVQPDVAVKPQIVANGVEEPL